jgi:hypothetical protein
MAEATRLGRIFMSYRREETAYAAGWLYDRLRERFGAGQIFKDVDTIQPGEDWVEKINYAVGSCDVLLALIGDRWLTAADADGKRRIDDPEDFVRLEVEAALVRNVLVVPILVDGARMPSIGDLPPSIAMLVRRQALELSPSRFDSDLSRLLRVLDSTLADASATGEESEVAGLVVWTERDTNVPYRDPSKGFIYQLISKLSLPGQGNNFLVIKRQGQRDSFAQTARMWKKHYLVEYRDGDAVRHFAASHVTLPEAQAALCGWAFSLPGWRDRLTWAQVPAADLRERARRNSTLGGSPVDPAMPQEAWVPWNQGKSPDNQRRRSNRRSLAVVGSIVVILVIIVVVASLHTTTPPAGQSSYQQLVAGDCLTGSNLQLNTSHPFPAHVQMVPCGQEHIAEVYYSFNYWAADQTWPGLQTINKQAISECTNALVSYIGNSIDSSSFDFFAIRPDSAQWDSGYRHLTCVAFKPTNNYPAGTPLYASIQGSARSGLRSGWETAAHRMDARTAAGPDTGRPSIKARRLGSASVAVPASPPVTGSLWEEYSQFERLVRAARSRTCRAPGRTAQRMRPSQRFCRYPECDQGTCL